jgi:hypothetical protein
MNVLHIAVLQTKFENPDLIKLLLHFGVDHQVSCFYEQVRSFILYILYIVYIIVNIYVQTDELYTIQAS